MPEKSDAWLIAGWALLTTTVGVATTAATASERVIVLPQTVWVIVAALLALAVVCFLAHWDSNRGRRFRHYEVVLEKEDYPRQ